MKISLKIFTALMAATALFLPVGLHAEEFFSIKNVEVEIGKNSDTGGQYEDGRNIFVYFTKSAKNVELTVLDEKTSRLVFNQKTALSDVDPMLYYFVLSDLEPLTDYLYTIKAEDGVTGQVANYNNRFKMGDFLPVKVVVH